MTWATVVLRAAAAVPYIFGFVAGAYVLIVSIAAMAAIWHPAASRRSAAYKVLALLLGSQRRAGRRDRDPP
jgi:hypothetical protein